MRYSPHRYPASARPLPTDMTTCEIKQMSNGTCYLFHRASGWISRPLTRPEAEQAILPKGKGPN